MSAPVLEVEHLGKVYRCYRRELHRVLGWFSIPIAPVEEHWVLRDIGFAVAPGEALGIVGRNGAGKSTLLKMITGTTRPTEGTVRLGGKVAAILELGMGFNPELTGRQNVYFAAGMMGFLRSETDGALGRIEDFAELGAYFEQPLRVYSSGMQMRLAFAVATAFRPDVLIIDEALAVGDTYFQHKSMDRIRSFREQGTSLILVSHDKMAVQSLCDRAILLDGGRVARDGTPESVLDYYNALIALKEDESIETRQTEGGRTQTISGSRKASIQAVRLLDAKGDEADVVNVGADVTLRVDVRVDVAVPRLVLGYAVKDRLGQTLYGTNTHYTGQAMENPPVGTEASFRIAFKAALGPGSYSVTLALSGSESHIGDNYEWRDLALLFTVVNLDKQTFDGNFFMPATIEVVEKPLPLP